MKTRRPFPVESDVGFHVAVKHLFRHLHEARMLRKNPLVEFLFKDPTIGGLGSKREQAILERIHQLIRLGSDYCRDVALADGPEDRALRQHAIIKLNCLDRQPLQEVAASLGISCGYCYSERAQICRRIARYLFIGEGATRARVAASSSTHRFANAALGRYEDIAEVIPSVIHTIEALRFTGFQSLRLGTPRPAIEAHAEATAILKGVVAADAPPLARDVTKASLDLFESKLAYYRGDVGQALNMAERAVEGLKPYRQTRSSLVHGLQVESLNELGCAFCNVGDWQRGYEYMRAAETQLTRTCLISPQLRVRVSLDVWRLRNLMPTVFGTQYTSRQRLQALTTLFEEACAAGAFYEATSSLATLTEYHAFTGNYPEMLGSARSAIRLANQQPGDRIRVKAALVVATAVLSSDYWEYGCELFPESAEVSSCEAYYQQLISYAAAERALRLRRFRDAFFLASSGCDEKGFTALSARRRLTAARAAHQLKRKREAQTMIEETVFEAERLGIAPLLRDAYHAAATLTEDARYKRWAREIGKIITA
ncbi:MAG: hypothetical protein WCC84_15265 [Candidatus Cybelea sp.]